MNFKLITKLSAVNRKTVLIIVVILLILITIIVGLYYGLKSKGSSNNQSNSIPDAKTDITTGKMIIYEPITLKSIGTCINGSTRFGFMDNNGNPVMKTVPTDVNFPEFKIILRKNSLYLKRFENTNRIKLWHNTTTPLGKTFNWILKDGFFGRILAYEEQGTGSPIYKYMIWLDFTAVPETVLDGWAELPKTGFYNLLMNTTTMTATLEYLDDLYVSTVVSELNSVCKQINPKSVVFNMKATSTDADN